MTSPLGNVGQQVLWTPKDGNAKDSLLAEVISVDESTRRLYVHFVERDRRMDRWVAHAEVRVAARCELTRTQTPPRRRTRAAVRELMEARPVSERVTGNAEVEREERDREERTAVRNVERIVFGEYEVDAWYYSPYLLEGVCSDLYICTGCLRYYANGARYLRHTRNCLWKRPPGQLMYEDNSCVDKGGHPLRVSVYEVDGLASTVYCQCLCLLGKLFLDHKTLCYDMTPFLFYVVTLNDEIAGFFSKSRTRASAGGIAEENLSCIVTLPQHQGKGVGRFLIQLSYELARLDRLISGPERPLSDLGQVSYRSHWTYEISQYIKQRRANSSSTHETIAIHEIINATMIQQSDVLVVLQRYGLHNIRGKCLKNDARIGLKKLFQAARPPKLPVNPHLIISDKPLAPTPNAAGKSKSQSSKSSKSNKNPSQSNKRSRRVRAPVVRVHLPQKRKRDPEPEHQIQRGRPRVKEPVQPPVPPPVRVQESQLQSQQETDSIQSQELVLALVQSQSQSPPPELSHLQSQTPSPSQSQSQTPPPELSQSSSQEEAEAEERAQVQQKKTR